MTRGRFTLTNVRPGEVWVSTEVKLNKDHNNKPVPFKAVTEVDIENTDIDGLVLRSENIDKKVSMRGNVKPENIKYCTW